MNPATVELALSWLNVLGKIVMEGQTLFSRLHNGVPLTDEELAAHKAKVDAADAVIEGWKPAAAAPPA